jgi:hypothetical protein
MLGSMSIIQDVWLHGNAFAKVFRRRLQEAVVLTTATHHRGGEENCRHEQTYMFVPSMFVTQL